MNTKELEEIIEGRATVRYSVINNVGIHYFDTDTAEKAFAKIEEYRIFDRKNGIKNDYSVIKTDKRGKKSVVNFGSKHDKKTARKESFALDIGDGEGYIVFYKTGGGFCFCYSVTFENGVAKYSKVKRLKQTKYNAARNKANVIRYY